MDLDIMNQQPTGKPSGAIHQPPNKQQQPSYNNKSLNNFYIQNQSTNLGHKPPFKKKFNSNYDNNSYSNGGGYQNGYKHHFGGNNGQQQGNYSRNKNYYRYPRNTANLAGTYNNKPVEPKCTDSVGNSFSNSNPVSPPTASSASSNLTESPPSKTGSPNNLDGNVVETNNCDTQQSLTQSDNDAKQTADDANHQQSTNEETNVEADKVIQTSQKIKQEQDLGDLSLIDDDKTTALANDIGNLQINQNAISQNDKQQTQSNVIEKQTQTGNHNYSQANRTHPNAHLSSFKSQFSNANVKQINKSHNTLNDNQTVPSSKSYDNKHYDKHQVTGSTGYQYNGRYANQAPSKHFYNNGYQGQNYHHPNTTGYQYQATSHHNTHNKSNYLRGKKPTSYSNSNGNLIPNKSHLPPQNQSTLPNNTINNKPHNKTVNNVPVSAPQNHLLNQLPVSQSHSVMPQIIPSNQPIFYSIPSNQLPQHQLNHSHNHSHPNIHPSNCFQCISFLTAQQNGYFGGNQQFAPANTFNSYQFVGIPYYNQQQQPQLNGNEDIQSQPPSQPQSNQLNSYRDTATPASVGQQSAGNHLNGSNMQTIPMRQFNNNYQMNARFNQQQQGQQQYNSDSIAYMPPPPPFNPMAYNPYVQFVPNYYQHYPSNSFIINNGESQMTQMTATSVANNSNLHPQTVPQQATVNAHYAINSGQSEQLFNSMNLETAVAAADSTTRSSSVHSVNYENGANQNGATTMIMPAQFTGEQMQQQHAVKYYQNASYQQQQEYVHNNAVMWQSPNTVMPVTNDDLIHSSSQNAPLAPNVQNVQNVAYQSTSVQPADNDDSQHQQPATVNDVDGQETR